MDEGRQLTCARDCDNKRWMLNFRKATQAMHIEESVAKHLTLLFKCAIPCKGPPTWRTFCLFAGRLGMTSCEVEMICLVLYEDGQPSLGKQRKTAMKSQWGW